MVHPPSPQEKRPLDSKQHRSNEKADIWPKRAINKTLFSQFINKPQRIRGRLPQRLKLLKNGSHSGQETHSIHFEPSVNLRGFLRSVPSFGEKKQKKPKTKCINAVAKGWQSSGSFLFTPKGLRKMKSNETNIIKYTK